MPWVLTQLCREDPLCDGCSASHAGRILHAMAAHPAVPEGPSR